MTDIDHFLRIIDEELARTGESDRALSLRATSSADTIRNARRNMALPSPRNLQGLADALKLSLDQLIGRTQPDLTPARSIEAVPATVGDVSRTFRHAPRDLPIYGTAHGHTLSFDGNGGIEVETTIVQPTEVIRYVTRPPALSEEPTAYALYVQGESMFPAHRPGELVVVDPRQPPAIGDDVIVQLADPLGDGREVNTVLIKTLVRRSASFVELQQYNPPAVFRVKAERIAYVHRVVPLGDLLGG